MDRLNSLVLLLALTVAASAQETILPGPIMRPMLTAPSCSSTDTIITTTNLILEGFQTATTGYEHLYSANTWTGVGTTANIYPASDSSALTSRKPTGACNQAMKIVFPADGTETFTRWDYGSTIITSISTIHAVLYIYVETAPAVGAIFRIFSVNDTTNVVSDVASIAIYNDAGTIKVLATAANNSTMVPITTGEWHKLALYLDISTTGNASNFTVDDGTPYGFNRNTPNLRYVMAGATYALEANNGGTVWYDLICVNSP